MDEKALLRPTYASFIALLDNYIAVTGQSEVVTEEEIQEGKQFLNVVMDTAVMQYVHKVQNTLATVIAIDILLGL